MRSEQSPPPPRTLVLYSDYSCPFSYILKSVVDRFIQTAAFPPEIEYHLFDLRGRLRVRDGGIDWSQDSPQDRYPHRVREAVDILSNQRAVVVKRNPPTRIDSWPAQKVAYWLKRKYPHIVFETFHHKVFSEMWIKNRDISDSSVLKDIARETGINTTKISEILNDDEFEDEFAAYLRRIKQQIPRISPTLVYQEQTVSGAISLGDIRRLVKFAKGHPADEMGMNLIPHYQLPTYYQ